MNRYANALRGIKRLEIVNHYISSGYIKVKDFYDYTRLYNMTQLEIDELLKETIELAKQMSGSLPIQQHFPFMSVNPNDLPKSFSPVMAIDPNDIPKNFSPEVKKECDHVFVPYQGLKESYHFCKKCDQKK